MLMGRAETKWKGKAGRNKRERRKGYSGQIASVTSVDRLRRSSTSFIAVEVSVVVVFVIVGFACHCHRRLIISFGRDVFRLRCRKRLYDAELECNLPKDVNKDQLFRSIQVDGRIMKTIFFYRSIRDFSDASSHLYKRPCPLVGS